MINVLDATNSRLDTLLDRFDNVVVAFSGGKDSGLLLNLVVKRIRDRGLDRRVVVMHQDFEAQYQATTDYVTRTLTSDLDVIEPYWLCLPMGARTACSMSESHWYPWDRAQESIWVRPLPTYPGVVTEDDCPFFEPGMTQEEVYEAFTPWVHADRGGRTVCLVGIRAQESLNRWRSVAKDRVGNLDGLQWTTRVEDDCYLAYPIYDWKTEDVWTANARFGFDYNSLYDTFHYAGIPLHSMRVASPFNEFAIGSLHLYKSLEPDTWARMVGRVNGVNFAAIYGGTKAMGWKSIDKPKHFSWRQYAEFLLDTMPKHTADNYRKKLAASKKSWVVGGGMSPETIAQLEAEGAPIRRTGRTTNHGKGDKELVQFDDYLDDTSVDDFAQIPTYKRLCLCIMKNDHLCKYMGFAQTKGETERRQAAIAKYKDL